MTPQIEVVGSVEIGIKAAAWSPDEELLVLVTGPSIAYSLITVSDFD